MKQMRRFTLGLLSVTTALTLLAGCARDRAYPRFSNAGQVPAGEAAGLSLHPPGETLENALPPQRLRAQEVEKQNPNAIGWLFVPDTGIDEVILFHPTDNHYYIRRGLDEAYSFEGVMYADRRSSFGTGLREELARNTTLYGHTDKTEDSDWHLTQLHRYLDPDFAAAHPYLYFSTTAEDMAWEVFAVFYAHVDVPYIRADLSDAELARVLDTVRAASVHHWNITLGEQDKILTLSTNLTDREEQGGMEPLHEYRFAVMARLVEPGEANKAQADIQAGTGAVAPARWD